jgi:hypothetical protein
MTKLTQAFVCLILCLSTSLLFLSCKKTDKANSSTVTSAPFPPTDLTATVISLIQVNLNWTDKSTNEAGFRLERKTPTTNFAVIATLGADITSYSDNGLTPNTTYTYRVYSYNSVGNSPTYSNEVTVTTIGLPSLTTSAVTNFTVVDGVSGGVITTDGGAPVTARGVVWSTSQNPTVALSTKTTDGSGTGTFTSTITGLTATTKYYVRAYATNAAGTAYGNEVNFTTNTIDLKNGLVAYYPFSGNAGDSSGNNNHGIVNGATLTTDRFGNANKAYSFNGTNQFISIKDNINFRPSIFSISVWINGIDFNGFNQVISKNAGTAVNESINLVVNNNNSWNVSAQVGGPNYYGTLLRSPNVLQTGVWNNITYVYRGIGLSQGIYINGNLVISNNSEFEIRYDEKEWYIGAQIENLLNNYFFRGSIDDVRIYNRALTQEEITYLSKQ